MAARERYAFGAFTLDVAERRLLQDDTPTRLTPKARYLAVTLVRRAGQLTTKRDGNESRRCGDSPGQPQIVRR